MANQNPGASVAGHPDYYVPPSAWYPVWVALGAAMLLGGLGRYLNATKAGAAGSTLLMYAGGLILTVALFAWFARVVKENHIGLTGPQLKRSYIWGMSWFIFSEVMFFAAFFAALFYARVFAVAWLGGEGEKGLTGDYLWPAFSAEWPVLQNPDPGRFGNPGASMASPGIANWGNYLPFWNTVILLSSSVTVHFAHSAVVNGKRSALSAWLALTVALGVLFLFLQVEEYLHAYRELGLTLDSGIYGSTFFLLTGFHGFHVSLGTFILAVQLVRALRGHFNANDQFGLEAASWYWHFVDVVWVCLFFFVYIF